MRNFYKSCVNRNQFDWDPKERELLLFNKMGIIDPRFYSDLNLTHDYSDIMRDYNNQDRTDMIIHLLNHNL